MLIKSIAAFAALTLAAGVAAEPKPYKPINTKMSARELFGRDDTPGYIPEQAACNLGATCEEACGAEYRTCASTDSQVHCFNPNAEICCPDKSGNSCENGYYCTSDKTGETFCCPDEMDLEECAAEYEVDGGLKSQTAPPETKTSTTSTSTSSSTTTTSSSSTAPPTTTTTTSSVISTTAGLNTTSVEIETSAPISTPSFVPSASFIPSNSTTISSVALPSPTESEISTGAGSIVGPTTALVFFAAGLAALL